MLPHHCPHQLRCCCVTSLQTCSSSCSSCDHSIIRPCSKGNIKTDARCPVLFSNKVLTTPYIHQSNRADTDRYFSDLSTVQVLYMPMLGFIQVYIWQLIHYKCQWLDSSKYIYTYHEFNNNNYHMLSQNYSLTESAFSSWINFSGPDIDSN